MGAKGTNEKIKELRGEKPEKISSEELIKVQNAVNLVNRAQIDIGSLEVRKHELLHQLVGIRESLGVIQDELKEKYDTIDVNINDGTINYDVKADS